MNDTKEPSASLACHASLAFHWQRLTDAELDHGLSCWQEQNLQTINNILLFEHLPRELKEEESETSLYLHRLDHKISLMMELLCQVMASQRVIPAAQLVDITADGLSWEADRLPSEGELILLEIYLSQHYPGPLTLPSEVTRISGTDCTVEFLSLTEALRDKLEQLIFLYHRRQIAESKKS